MQAKRQVAASPMVRAAHQVRAQRIMGFDEAGCGWVIVALGSQPPGQRSAGRAADAVLVRDGPGVVTVRPVAAQAGIAPMGVYNRLSGKDGLVDALLIRGFDRLRAALAEKGE